MSAEIELRNVSCVLGKAFKLASVSCKIPSGTCLGIIGPSGCGKSTLLNLIGGHATLKSGEIWIGGKDVSSLPPGRRGTATVFQDFALLPHLTVEENICFGFRYNARNGKARDVLVEELLSKFALASCRKRLPERISGGEKQRTAIARALVNSPACLLLDEPTASLGRNQRDEVASLLSRLANEFADTTIVLVTHDYEFAFSVCDMLAVLNKRDTPKKAAEQSSKNGGESRLFWPADRLLRLRKRPQSSFSEDPEVLGYLAGHGRTQEIVTCPPSIEIAEILGGHTILHGKVQPNAMFQSDDGAISFSLAPACNLLPSIDIQRCSVLIRSTEVSLDTGCLQPLATGHVTTVEFRGNFYRLTIAVGRNRVLCDVLSTDGIAKWGIGNQVTVCASGFKQVLLTSNNV